MTGPPGRSDLAFMREIQSPASPDKLADLGARCGRLLLGVLNDSDARRVGEFLAARPDLEVAIWAPYGTDLDFLRHFPPLVELEILHCGELADLRGLEAHAESLTALRLTTRCQAGVTGTATIAGGSAPAVPAR